MYETSVKTQSIPNDKSLYFDLLLSLIPTYTLLMFKLFFTSDQDEVGVMLDSFE